MTYQLSTASVWDGSQWVAAAGGSKPWYEVLPSVGSALTVTVTASASTNTKGAWIELVASSAQRCDLLNLRAITTVANGANTSFMLDIGVGASGSEQVVFANLPCGYSATVGNTYGYPANFYRLPVAIPSGSRIAVRAQSQTSLQTCTVTGWLATDVTPSTAIVDTLGANTATSTGVSPSVSNTWAEVTASTSADYAAIMVAIAGNGTSFTTINNVLVDVGIGAAGAETVIASTAFTFQSQEAISRNHPSQIASATIPAGSRLSVRVNTANANMSFVLFGVRP